MFNDSFNVRDTPYDVMPHLDRISSALRAGKSLDAAVYGDFSAKSMQKLRAKRLHQVDSFTPPVHAISDKAYSSITHVFSDDFNPFIEGNPDEINQIASFQGVHRDWSSRRSSFRSLNAIRPYVTSIYKRVMKEKDVQKADEILLDIERRLHIAGNELTAHIGPLNLLDNEEKFSEYAEKLSFLFTQLLVDRKRDPVYVSYLKNKRKRIYQMIEFPSMRVLHLCKIILGMTAQDVAERCDVNLMRDDKGNEYLPNLYTEGLEPFLNRLKTRSFILQRLRVTKRLVLADFFREYGFICRSRESFVSDFLVRDRKYQKQRNAHLLENLVCYNKDDPSDFQVLSDLVARSSNGLNCRFAELVARFKGFAEYGEEYGYQGAMLTLTTPSRFHSFSERGFANVKWLKAGKPTVKDGADWLGTAWNQIQARFAKSKIKPYGFKFIEPHHDGTIHYHIAIWFRPEDKREIQRHIADVMLAEKESGALKHRFDWTDADQGKGAAGMLGYFIPYITKNTSGKNLKGHDASNDTAETAAERVDTWKCDYRLRQFAQFGGPSITVWRKLRLFRKPFIEGSKMFEHLTHAEWFQLETLRLAADASDYKKFIVAMGGVGVARDKQTLQIRYQSQSSFEKVFDELDKEFTAEFKRTRYGDLATLQVMGLKFPYTREIMEKSPDGFVIKMSLYQTFIDTRTTEWVIVDKKRFKAMQQRAMGFVRDQFKMAISRGYYEGMDPLDLLSISELVDWEQSLFDRALALECSSLEDAEFEKFNKYINSEIVENLLNPFCESIDDMRGVAVH